MSFQDLNATNRCDACNAQARVHYEHETEIGPESNTPLDFLFCSHHSYRYGADLIKLGYKVIADTREELTPKPVGAEVA